MLTLTEHKHYCAKLRLPGWWRCTCGVDEAATQRAAKAKRYDQVTGCERCDGAYQQTATAASAESRLLGHGVDLIAHKRATTLTMSRFNTQMVCIACINAERAHPDYPAAEAAELASVRAGNYNFEGVGLPPDLEHHGHP